MSHFSEKPSKDLVTEGWYITCWVPGKGSDRTNPTVPQCDEAEKNSSFNYPVKGTSLQE